jgi:multidrug resistance protein, MATE family
LYLVGFLEWAIVAWSNWEQQVEKAFARMDHDDRAEIGQEAAADAAT